MELSDGQLVRMAGEETKSFLRDAPASPLEAIVRPADPIAEDMLPLARKQKRSIIVVQTKLACQALIGIADLKAIAVSCKAAE